MVGGFLDLPRTGFVQALLLCEKAGMVKLGNVAIDGTKMMANASTRRSVPYPKLSEREQYWKSKVEELLTAARRTDEEEDQRYGKGQAADPLPDALAHAQSRLECIRKAKAQLEKEAQEQLAATLAPRRPGRPRKEEVAVSGPEHQREQDKAKKRRRRAQQNAAQPTRQYNFTDPDSRVMKDNGRKCFVQGYNAQIAVDTQAQVIVAADVTQKVTDREQLVPMVQNVCATMGHTPNAVTLDAGYWDTASLHHPALQGIQVLVSPDSKARLPGEPLPACAPRNEEAIRMREFLATEAGRDLYALRKCTVEPVFGQIKEGRGIRRFRLRGFQQVRSEWSLICATHNLLKLFRNRTAIATA